MVEWRGDENEREREREREGTKRKIEWGKTIVGENKRREKREWLGLEKTPIGRWIIKINGALPDFDSLLALLPISSLWPLAFNSHQSCIDQRKSEGGGGGG